MMGRKINTLIEQQLPVGTYSVEWDGKDFDGSDQMSGIYVYILDVNYSKGHETRSKKLIKR
jgi:flagellar hook assembly protein FlgD